MYSHRLMHRKRVTCELHDSYFQLMTIKHAIPKILSGRLNYYITQWRQEVSSLEMRWRQDAVEKARTQQSGPPGWAALENEKDTTLMAIRVGVNILQFCSVSNSLSHANLTIKWKVYLFKDCVARLHCLVVIIIVFCMNLHMTI